MRLFILLLFLPFGLQNVAAQQATLQSEMSQAANHFLQTLTPGERQKALLDFHDPTRTEWSNEPVNMHPRKGLRLDEMTDVQKKALHRLLQTTLSEQGYLKAINVIRLDEWLKEHKDRDLIDEVVGQGLYWITIFGRPDISHRWGWRFEGHHLSLNITVSPEGIDATPFFLGAHPGVIPEGPLAGTENLFEETRLGWRLLESLTDAQRKKAIISSRIPQGAIVINTGKEPEAKTLTGIPVASLNAEQQRLVWQIINCYVQNLTPPLAKHYTDLIREKAWQDLHFVWMGATQEGKPAYYRIQSASGFIIEYCTRGLDIAHIHTLWHWLPGDFGVKTAE
ncbi:MAG: DUF3500 domain-containing protein [Chitinophagaceae bacterium]|nr:MAG: DUF3500 domain-containing protein [Chitinophagaceae bacterium]